MTLLPHKLAAALPRLPGRAFPWSKPRYRLDELRQLVCRSLASKNYSQAELEDLLLNLHLRQDQQGGQVSGALLHHGDVFLYCLEGPEKAVVDAFARLGRDAHHHSVEEMLYRPISARSFPTWVAASTSASGGGWLDLSTAQWETHRHALQRAVPSPGGGLMNRVWENFSRPLTPSRLAQAFVRNMSRTAVTPTS